MTLQQIVPLGFQIVGVMMCAYVVIYMISGQGARVERWYRKALAGAVGVQLLVWAVGFFVEIIKIIESL